MGKGLIGNSLSYVMRAVLNGEVSADDIDKIYEGTCITENRMSNFINEIESSLGAIAMKRAEREICQKYGFKSLWDTDDAAIFNQVALRAKELFSEVIAEAEGLLHNLWDSNKIIQTRYRIPEGQSVVAKVTPANRQYDQDEHAEYETQGNSRREVVQINGEFYEDWNNSSCLVFGGSKLFNSELELIANQLRKGYSLCNESKENETRIFFMQKLFPQYKDAIAQVSDLEIFLGEEAILKLLNEALRQNGEHTAEEIGEGIGDLTQSEVGEALNTITDIGEPQKDPHSIE